MKFDLSRLQNEPVITTASLASIITAAFTVFNEFGIVLSDGQKASITSLVILVFAYIARAYVTPVKLAKERMEAGQNPIIPHDENIELSSEAKQIVAAVTKAQKEQGS